MVPGTIDLYSFAGNNGSNSAGNFTTEGLAWSVTSDNPNITITQNGVLQDLTGTSTGSFSGVVTLMDADGSSANGGLSAICNINTTFGKDPVNAAFSGCNEISGNKGAISQGFYWVSNKTNASTQTTSSGTVFYPARQPISGLDLGNDLAIAEKSVAVTRQECFPVNGTAPKITNKNTNIIYGSNQAQSNLSAGTAFISVDFELGIYSGIQGSASGFFTDPTTGYNNKGPDVLFPCFLQYRSAADSLAGNNNWVRANDIEGSQIFFGGIQDANYPDAIASQNTYSTNTGSYSTNNGGVIMNKSTADGSLTGNTTVSNPRDVMQVSTQYNPVNINGNNYSNSNLIGRGNRTFAIGKDQSYNNSSNNKFGDYRLIIGYPWGRAEYYGNTGIPLPNNNPKGVVTINLPLGSNPSLTNVRCPQAPGNSNNSVFWNSDKYKITLKYGDFYYPKDYPSCPSSTSSTSYEYRVSVGANNTGSAASLQPNISVFAKEWHLKYITQFFTDAALSIPWVPVQSLGAYHSYIALENASKNGRDGTSNSYMKGLGANMSTNDPGTNNTRRWTAQFNSTGLKTARTAQPNEYGN